MAALVRRGLKVAPFKVGPDFIDPGHHARIAQRPSRNLDGWMLSRAYNQSCFARHAADADVAVVEGVMGLFDGYGGNNEAGSTAQMAKWLGLPVILVVNAASMARSAAALVRGFVDFDPGLSFAGVLFNHLGSAGHLAYLKAAMEAYVTVPLLGGLVRDEALRMPERHLGLMTAEDLPLSEADMERLAHRVEAAIDLDRLLSELPEIKVPAHPDEGRRRSTAPVRLAVARDRAFCFYYPDNLDLLAGAGAQLVPFSPLDDATLPEALDGIYLGGGYPELHGAMLSGNAPMRQAILQCSRAGMPIYAECGGFMYLCSTLKDRDGGLYPMCGCFPFQAEMHPRLRTLGYREIRLTADALIGARGAVVRGHEFHYSDLAGEGQTNPPATAYAVADRKGNLATSEGYTVRRTLGSYIHLHFGSRRECAGDFVAACRSYRQARSKTKT